MLRLADLDLKNGATIVELIYECCAWYPKKEGINALIDCGKQTTGENEIVSSIFEFKNARGLNCLQALFNMSALYNIRNNRYPDNALFSKIEESVLYLVKLARLNDLGSERIMYGLDFYNSDEVNQLIKRTKRQAIIDEELNSLLSIDLFDPLWVKANFENYTVSSGFKTVF